MGRAAKRPEAVDADHLEARALESAAVEVGNWAALSASQAK